MKLESWLITGAKYSGTIHEGIGVMDGFGSYTYPDGSTYRGFFKMGKLHGYGCLTTIPPRQFLLFTQFKEGKLVKIEEIVFSDGLKFTNLQSIKHKHFDNWHYLNKHDRRYASELYTEIYPVGSNAYLTNQYQTRNIPLNQYDAEEGFYNPRSGFVGYCLPDIHNQKKLRFVSCYKEKNWIRRQCRRSDKITLPEHVQIDAERDILNNNHSNVNQEYCFCENKKYYIDSKNNCCCKLNSSTTSTSTNSFKDIDLKEGLFGNCLETDNHSEYLDKKTRKSFKLVQKPLDYYFKVQQPL